MMEKVTYEIRLPDSAEVPGDAVRRFREAINFPVFWKRKNRPLDLKNVVDFLSIGEGNRIEMRLRLDREGVLRPEEALGFICGGNEEGGPSAGIQIQKVRVQFKESESCPAKS
jgi:hypothetical protein